MAQRPSGLAAMTLAESVETGRAGMTDNLKSPAPPVRAKFHEGAAEYFSSRNHKAPLSSKHYHVRIDSEPHNGSCPAMTASAVNGLNQFTKRQCLLAIGFHDAHLSFAYRAGGVAVAGF